jgi:hypothetical protein
MQVRDSFFAINAKSSNSLALSSGQCELTLSGLARHIQFSKNGDKKSIPLYMAPMCAPRAKMGVRPQRIFCGKWLYGRE